MPRCEPIRSSPSSSPSHAHARNPETLPTPFLFLVADRLWFLGGRGKGNEQLHWRGWLPRSQTRNRAFDRKYPGGGLKLRRRYACMARVHYQRSGGSVLCVGPTAAFFGHTVCMVAPANGATLRVAEKNGYRETGRTTYHGKPTILLEQKARLRQMPTKVANIGLAPPISCRLLPFPCAWRTK